MNTILRYSTFYFGIVFISFGLGMIIRDIVGFNIHKWISISIGFILVYISFIKEIFERKLQKSKKNRRMRND